MMNIAKWRVICGRERPLGLFEVLARNRQSAVGLSAVREAHEKNNPNVYNTSSTITVLSHAGWRYEHGELHVPESESESE